MRVVFAAAVASIPVSVALWLLGLRGWAPFVAGGAMVGLWVGREDSRA